MPSTQSSGVSPVGALKLHLVMAGAGPMEATLRTSRP